MRSRIVGEIMVDTNNKEISRDFRNINRFSHKKIQRINDITRLEELKRNRKKVFCHDCKLLINEVKCAKTKIVEDWYSRNKIHIRPRKQNEYNDCEFFKAKSNKKNNGD